MASGKLLLPLFDELPSGLPDWLRRAIDPNQPVVFLNTDQVLKYLAEYNVCVHRVAQCVCVLFLAPHNYYHVCAACIYIHTYMCEYLCLSTHVHVSETAGGW